MKATSAVMLVVIGLILGLMLAYALQQAGHNVGVDSTAVPSASTRAPPTVDVPATQPQSTAVATLDLYGQVRPGIYPCADPTNICDHLKDIGCAVHSWCRNTIGKLGEDVCLKLYEAKSASQVESKQVPLQTKVTG